MDKVVASAAEAVADIGDGASLAVGGFGMSGVPTVLIAALLEQGATDLETISNNLGVDGFGLAPCSPPGASGARSAPTSATTRSSPASTSPASWSWS